MGIWKSPAVPGRRVLAGTAAVVAIGTGLVGTQLHRVTIQIQGPQGTRRLRLWSFRSHVRGALAQAGIRLGAHDRVRPGLGARLSAVPITVSRAIQVTVNTPHHHWIRWTTDYRVRAVLASMAVRLHPLDLVQPAPGARLQNGAVITVTRRWWQQEVTTSTLPFSVQYQPDPALYKGHQEIAQTGRDGLAQTVRDVLMADGKPVQTRSLARKVIRPPQPEIIRYGTAPLVARGGQVLQYTREITMVATAYWPNPAWSDGITATGIPAHYGVAAVDPSVIPLGTRLYIPGYGFAVAADTGSAIVGDRIDLCYNTAWQAQDFGVQTVPVFELAP
ncbi:MAG: G5 domain-containing protein [Firmicutes bacterium]|nr:G5 domain-containing protein [Bacillota bacterium]